MSNKLKKYLDNEDSQKWWRLSSGEMENLFDDAIYVIDRQKIEIDDLKKKLDLYIEK